MTTGADIVLAAGNFLGELDALLQTPAMAGILELARELGVGPELAAAVDAILLGLTEIATFLASIGDSLVQIGALSGLLGVTAALVGALEGLTRATADELAPLGGAASVATALAGPLDLFGRLADGGAAVLAAAPTPESITEVQHRLADLTTTLQTTREALA